ncbi:ABC transporter permease [Streptomyces sp. NPDC004629]|uniref:ABC transporter permease n=1 Tax=Streptomyces sp. NPDC004629 TaxID=3364705 RepID=UPI003681AE9E
MGIFDVAFLVSVVTIAAPILLAATGELVSERAGVLNVGLEGVLLAGAFGGYLGMRLTGSILPAFLTGIAAGLLFGAVMAVLAIEAKVDQIVAGIALTMLGYGVTAFLDERFLGSPRTFEPLPRLAVPGLSDLPVVGPALFDQDAFIYAAAVMVVLVGLALGRTTWGINLKAVGESPAAADAAGVGVRGMRWAAVLFSGLCAGAAGAYLSVGDVGVFREGMTGGRGYLAIAAVLFGGWRMTGLGTAVAVFAVADATQLRLQAVGGIPREVWVTAAVLVLLATALARFRRRGTRTRPVARPTAVEAAGLACTAVLAVLAVTAPTLTVPVPLWLGMPYLLALVALGTEGKRRHRAPEALAVPYLRSEV